MGLRMMWRGALLAMAAGVSACGTTAAVYDAVSQGDQAPSELSKPIVYAGQLPYASAYVRSGTDFQGLMVLGIVSPTGVQTWYGRDGLAVQIDAGRMIYSRGLPLDILDSYSAAAVPADASTIDCGDGQTTAVTPALYYTRMRESDTYLAEVRDEIRCSRENIVTPGYSGPALRIDERYVFPPHPKPQRRSRWLIEATGQLLRIEYDKHPLYPEIGIYLLKPVKAP